MGFRILNGLVSVSLVWTPFAGDFALAGGDAPVNVLRSQADRIRRHLAPSLAVYRRAKASYEIRGPQGFIDEILTTSLIEQEDARALLEMFRGLPALPEVQSLSRGFVFLEPVSRQAVRVEVVDEDNRSFKINGLAFQFRDKESLDAGARRIQSLLETSPSKKVGVMEKAWGYMVPEAHAFIAPLLLGGAIFVIFKLFTGKGKKDTADAQAQDKKLRDEATNQNVAANSGHAGQSTSTNANGSTNQNGSSPAPGATVEQKNSQEDLAQRLAKLEKEKEELQKDKDKLLSTQNSSVAESLYQVSVAHVNLHLCMGVETGQAKQDANDKEISNWLTKFSEIHGIKWITEPNPGNLHDFFAIPQNRNKVVEIYSTGKGINKIALDEIVRYKVTSDDKGTIVVKKFVGEDQIGQVVDCKKPGFIYSGADKYHEDTPSHPATHPAVDPPSSLPGSTKPHNEKNQEVI